MLTLTRAPVPGESQLESTRAIKYAWSKFRRRLARYYGVKTINYVCIQEWTQRGQPHLHILLQTPYIRQRVASAMWRQCSGNPVVDIRKISVIAGAAAYLSDYLTKDQHMPPRQRKWTCSRGTLPQLPPREYTDDEQKPWIVHSNMPLETLAESMATAGWHVFALGESELVAFPPPTWSNAHPEQAATSTSPP